MFLFRVEIIYLKPFPTKNPYRVAHADFLSRLRVQYNMVEQTMLIEGKKEIIEFKRRFLDTKKEIEDITITMGTDPYIVHKIASFEIKSHFLLDFPPECARFAVDNFLLLKFVHNLMRRTPTEALGIESDKSRIVVNHIPTNIDGITGREYLLKLSSFLCELMENMLLASCYENYITKLYLGDPLYIEEQERIKLALKKLVHQAIIFIKHYENVRHHIIEGVKKQYEEAISGMVALLGFIGLKKEIEELENLRKTANAGQQAREQFITVTQIKTLLTTIYLNESKICQALVEYMDAFNDDTLLAQLKDLMNSINSNWELLKLYKRVLQHAGHKEFSDISLLIRYTGNIHSIEDSGKNSLKDFIPGNRCIDPLMQYSLNAIAFYSTNFCKPNAKEYDEFRNNFIDAYVVVVNNKRNHYRTQQRLHNYLIDPLAGDTHSLRAALTTEIDIIRHSLKTMQLFKDWIIREQAKLLKPATVSSIEKPGFPNFIYIGKSIPEAQSRESNRNKTAISVGVSLKRRPSMLKVEKSITKTFEDTVTYINRYVELSETFFSLVELATQCATRSPEVLAKINELFCLGYRDFLISDHDLSRILKSQKPAEMIENLKKEASERASAASKEKASDREQATEIYTPGVFLSASNWLKSQFSSSGSNTPFSSTRDDNQDHKMKIAAPLTPQQLSRTLSKNSAATSPYLSSISTTASATATAAKLDPIPKEVSAPVLVATLSPLPATAVITSGSQSAPGAAAAKK